MRSLIIDVRGNPGGLLSAAVEVADRFIGNGRIVTTRGRNARENFDYMAHRANTWNVKLAVLIDRDSASASEIFAGAIADSGRGDVIGETSYGKGSVQGIFRMQTAKFGLCLTTAKFLFPQWKGNQPKRRGAQCAGRTDLHRGPTRRPGTHDPGSRRRRAARGHHATCAAKHDQPQAVGAITSLTRAASERYLRIADTARWRFAFEEFL